MNNVYASGTEESKNRDRDATAFRNGHFLYEISRLSQSDRLVNTECDPAD